MNPSQISARIYQIITKLKFDDRVQEAGNPPTLCAQDRHELIDELDRLYLERRTRPALKGDEK